MIIIIIMSWDDGYLERKEPFCLYNNGPVARLFAYRSSYKEVLLHKGVLKKSSKFSCKKTSTSMCNFDKVTLQLYIKITLQHECSLVNLKHFSAHLIRTPLRECCCVY